MDMLVQAFLRTLLFRLFEKRIAKINPDTALLWTLGALGWLAGLVYAREHFRRPGMYAWNSLALIVIALIYRKRIMMALAFAWVRTRRLRAALALPVRWLASRTWRQWASFAWTVLFWGGFLGWVYFATYEARLRETLSTDYSDFRETLKPSHLALAIADKGYMDAKVYVLRNADGRHLVVVHRDIDSRAVAWTCMYGLPEYAVNRERVASISWTRSLGWRDWLNRIVVTREDVQDPGKGGNRDDDDSMHG